MLTLSIIEVVPRRIPGQSDEGWVFGHIVSCYAKVSDSGRKKSKKQIMVLILKSLSTSTE